MMVTYLNRGMYDVVEAARLADASPSQVVRWGQSTSRRGPVIAPSLDGLYSFHDLISLRVVVQLVSRRLRLEVIAAGVADLVQRLQTERPLAHEEVKLGTVGAAFFAHASGEWIDVGKGGQAAFQELVLPAVKGVEYGVDHLAELWRPVHRVWLNPRVQAGASCIDHTRIPTATIHGLIQRGEHPLDIAGDYDLALDDVMAAEQFEQGLRRAA